MGVKEKGCLSRPEISEYWFKKRFSVMGHECMFSSPSTKLSTAYNKIRKERKKDVWSHQDPSVSARSERVNKQWRSQAFSSGWASIKRFPNFQVTGFAL